MNKQSSPSPARRGGRIASPYPEFLKKLRATPEEQTAFFELLRSLNPTGDTRQDFEVIFKALNSAEIAPVDRHGDPSPRKKGKS